MKTTDKQTDIATALVGALACTTAQAQSAESTCKFKSLAEENVVTRAPDVYARMAGKPTPSVLAVLLVCAFSVSSAVFLINELSRPFDGLIRISGAPMLNALQHLAR
jgi:hypothetical protein